MIDRNKIFEMAKEGFTRRVIAERLGCSIRQVTRIIKQIEKDKNITLKSDPLLKDYDVEIARRNIYKRFLPANQIATKFGISKQAILQGKQ